MTDVCGNQSTYAPDTIYITDRPLYLVSTPVPDNDTIFVKTGRSISPDMLGRATWKSPEGIEERVLSGKAVVYPNPNNGKFTLRYTSSVPQELKVVLYDLIGQKLEEKRYRLHSGENEMTFRLTVAGTGLCFLKTENEKGRTAVLRFMVKK